MLEKIQFTLNGKPVQIEVDGDRRLLWVLRTELGLTGPKYGCGEGICGACTVLVNNEAAQSCQIPASSVNGQEVVTVEGLEKDGRLHPVQKAFIRHDALQCGYCTSGMIMKAVGLLNENPDLTRDDIIRGMDDNLCRCGAHTRIVDAVQTAAVEMKEGK